MSESIKGQLDRDREDIRRQHEEGLGGMEVSRKLCEAVDRAIVHLFEQQKGGFTGALVALGGYGRGVLNPYSDIDLLFLMNEPAHLPANRPPETMLASLWDLGLKVGHAARTIHDAMAIGKQDSISRTSMMESRFIAGSKDLYDQFARKYRWEIVRSKPGAFISEKMDELKTRRDSYGGVIRLTEPNVKNSPGGLRDLQAAMWMIRVRENLESIEAIANVGLVVREDVVRINDAYDFLMRLRNSLHFIAGSSFDKLAHELQPQAARLEGIEGSENQRSAVLMKKYYGACQEIRDFTDELVSLAAGYGKFGKIGNFKPPKMDKLTLFPDSGRLRAKAFPPQRLEDEPDILSHLLWRVCEEDLNPSRKVLRGLEWLRDNAPPGWFEGPKAGALLMGALQQERCERAIRVLLRSGILGRMIPEFEEINGLTQFDRYHRYSVDEHILHTMRKLEAIPSGHGISHELRALYRHGENLAHIRLALLLHDLGKRAEDRHAVEECVFVRPILERLGLEDMYDEIYFLVKNHLVMSETAQKLNFQDPETLRRFCRITKGRDNLKNLYLLTYADIAAVGPDIWTEWKDRLLLNLYNLAEKYYIEGEALFVSGPEQVAALAESTAQLAGLVSVEAATGFLEKAPEKYIQTATPESIKSDIELMARTQNSRLAMLFSTNPGDKSGEFTLAFPARVGMLSKISGAFAAKDINIVEMIVHTFKDGMALDTVVGRGLLAGFNDPEVVAGFEMELNELMEGRKSASEMIRRRTRYIKKAQDAREDIEPQAAVLNHMSESFTLVEIMARDRLGLLHDITSVLASLNISIESAKIATEGDLAVNVFYVTDESGKKLCGKEIENELTSKLMETLGQP